MILYWTTTSILVLAVLCGFCWSQEAAEKPQMNTEPVNLTAVEGGEAVMPCSVANLGKNLVSWRGPKGKLISMGKTILTSDKARFQVLNDYQPEWNLQISKVRSSDAGNYTCSIPNTIQVKSIFLLVFVPPSIVNSELQDSYEVLEGTAFSVTCQARGVPKPTIKWFRIIKSESQLVQEGETLVIPSIRKSDSGNYMCVANNEIKPEAEYTIQIMVAYPPKVTVRPKKISQSLGKETVLSCIVESYPHATIIWSFGDKELQNSWKYKTITHTETNGQALEALLTILGIEMSDEGTYQCLATNSYGSDEGTSVLQVRTPTWTTPMPTISTTMETPPTSPETTSQTQRSTKSNEIFVTDASSGNGGEYVNANQHVMAVVLIALLSNL
ncbi:hypothetical protein ACJMK2_035877 [Sinanodonta woodiana]|uniref:Ig-like domain-containing protein n=1 Tax=Sinanodonta woodiana TaxID=1069815 RepID=A0ABD3WFF8_SINWO